MPKKVYTSVPPGYPVCVCTDCPMAVTCLHQFAYKKTTEKTVLLHIVNPKRCSKDAKCEFYRDTKPVTYARGFTNFQKKMFPNQYQLFMATLIGQFGRNAYFERRRGETALSPKEQQIVLAALRKVGIKEKMDFDSYEEKVNWYD